jgi:hypothetical protein
MSRTLMEARSNSFEPLVAASSLSTFFSSLSISSISFSMFFAEDSAKLIDDIFCRAVFSVFSHLIIGSRFRSNSEIIALVSFSSLVRNSNSSFILPECFFIKALSTLLCEPLTSPKRFIMFSNLSLNFLASFAD